MLYPERGAHDTGKSRHDTGKTSRDVTGNNIWRADLTTHALAKFPLPTPNSFPEDITAGADGNLWFTEESAGKIGRITTNGAITEFGNGDLASPRSITDGPDGNVWFTLSFNPAIGRITPAGEITLFPTPSNPEQITRGRGNTLSSPNSARTESRKLLPTG